MFNLQTYIRNYFVGDIRELLITANKGIEKMAGTMTDLLNLINQNNDKLLDVNGKMSAEIVEIKTLLQEAKNGDLGALDAAIAKLTAHGADLDALGVSVQGISDAIQEQAITKDSGGGLGFGEGGNGTPSNPDAANNDSSIDDAPPPDVIQ